MCRVEYEIDKYLEEMDRLNREIDYAYESVFNDFLKIKKDYKDSDCDKIVSWDNFIFDTELEFVDEATFEAFKIIENKICKESKEKRNFFARITDLYIVFINKLSFDSDICQDKFLDIINSMSDSLEKERATA